MVRNTKNGSLVCLDLGGRLGISQEFVQVSTNRKTKHTKIVWDRRQYDLLIEEAHAQMITEEERAIAEEERKGNKDMRQERDRVNRKRDNISLGKTRGYDGLEDQNGRELITDDEVVEAVDACWSAETESPDLGAEGAEEEKLWEQFLGTYLDKSFPADRMQEPGEEMFIEAAGVRKRTSVGMDGLPFELFNFFPLLMGRFLQAIYWGLKVGAVPMDMLREARLCLPPKKDGRMVDGRYLVRVDQLRPLSVHVVIFRIIYLVLSWSCKDIQDDVLDPEQTGHKGCASNILWLDGEMGVAASQNSGAGALLIDFKGAFTSLRHRYLIRLFRFMGAPEWLVRMIEVGFMGLHHVFVWKGRCIKMMRMLKGVTMGNPLAALCFNIGLNPGIRALAQKLREEESIRGYMDDLALVLAHMGRITVMLALLGDF